ncbi:MAG: hypothetical protein IPI17_02495 [Nitrosomonas sp.]|nr:hypothetical protein [Nitrosomonas sp.]
MDDNNYCPLTAQDAYELKFEMQKTRETLEKHAKQMTEFHERIGRFERLFYEGKGVGIGVKIGAIAVFVFIGSLIGALWAMVTGRLGLGDVFKLF